MFRCLYYNSCPLYKTPNRFSMCLIFVFWADSELFLTTKLRYTFPHIAIAPMDYEALNVDLTFVPGEIPRVCDNVTVLNDDISENPEDFFVTLSTTDPSAEVDPDRDVATATINDLDGKKYSRTSLIRISLILNPNLSH